MIAQKHANGDQTWTERETYFLAKGSTYTRPNMHVGTLGWDKPWWRAFWDWDWDPFKSILLINRPN